MKKYIIIGFVALLILSAIGSCSEDDTWDEHDKIMSSYDWGPDHYYNSQTHQVEETPW